MYYILNIARAIIQISICVRVWFCTSNKISWKCEWKLQFTVILLQTYIFLIKYSYIMGLKLIFFFLGLLNYLLAYRVPLISFGLTSNILSSGSSEWMSLWPLTWPPLPARPQNICNSDSGVIITAAQLIATPRTSKAARHGLMSGRLIIGDS